MNVLDLFSGIGGFSLGLERAGMKTVAFCEQDKYCQKVLGKHWPIVPIFEDIKLLTKRNDMLEYGSGSVKIGKIGTSNIDLICGGFPCQDISVAGKKRGLSGNRSGLWKEFYRLIKEISPRWVIIENVANLRNLGLARIIKDLWKIGYVGEWHIISARSVGACHLRERIWIIAYPKCERSTQREYEKRIGWNPTRREKEAPALSTVFGEITKCNQVKPTNTKSIGNRGDTETMGEEVGDTKKQKVRAKPERKNEDIKRSWASEQRGSEAALQLPNANLPRLWKTFATEEEKSEWWAKTTAGFRDWWKIESEFRRVDDELSRGLDKVRRERIKMLGNSIVPQIAELIGKEIMKNDN